MEVFELIQAKLEKPITDLVSDGRVMVWKLNAVSTDSSFFHKPSNVSLCLFSDVILIFNNKRTDNCSFDDLLKETTPDNTISKPLELIFAADLTYLKTFGVDRWGRSFYLIINFHKKLEKIQLFFKVSTAELTPFTKLIETLQYFKPDIAIGWDVEEDIDVMLAGTSLVKEKSMIPACLKAKKAIIKFTPTANINSIADMRQHILETTKKSLSVTLPSRAVFTKAVLKDEAGSSIQHNVPKVFVDVETQTDIIDVDQQNVGKLFINCETQTDQIVDIEHPPLPPLPPFNPIFDENEGDGDLDLVNNNLEDQEEDD